VVRIRLAQALLVCARHLAQAQVPVWRLRRRQASVPPGVQLVLGSVTFLAA